MKIDKVPTSEAGRHPYWCDRDHVEGLHLRVLGEAPLAVGVVEVAVTQYLDRLPVVTIYRHEQTETGVEDLTPQQAESLARLLIAAVTELGGAR